MINTYPYINHVENNIMKLQLCILDSLTGYKVNFESYLTPITKLQFPSLLSTMTGLFAVLSEIPFDFQLLPYNTKVKASIGLTDSGTFP